MRVNLGSVRQWHWVSAAITLVGMLLFAITGITLNHAADIGGNTQVTTIETWIPEPALQRLRNLPEGEVMLPTDLYSYLREQGVTMAREQRGQWDGVEFYAAMPKPGADAWLAIDAEFAEFTYERTDRGWVAYFNDLHKGRDSGAGGSGLSIFLPWCVWCSVLPG